MRKAYLIVEGHGEIEAAHNLVIRLWADLDLGPIVWKPPKRGTSLTTRPGILKACEILRSEADCSAALLLRDADDDCPKETAPTLSGWIAELGLPFPVAVVLAYKEFEAWFLPCVREMAGREIRDGLKLEQDATWEGDPETIRGVKEWLSEHLFPKNKAYKPSLDQLALTRLIRLDVLRSSGVRSFGTLENALRFLASRSGAAVYPPPKGARPEPPAMRTSSREASARGGRQKKRR